MQVSRWLKDNGESKHAAVYAVAGKDETVNFVGVSRNVALAVAAHVANEGEEKVHSLKVRYPVTVGAAAHAASPHIEHRGILFGRLLVLA